MELVLYYRPTCPYCVKVFHQLEANNITIPMVNISEDPRYKEELKEKGGKVQVPCLMKDGKALYESDLIIEWIIRHKDEINCL